MTSLGRNPMRDDAGLDVDEVDGRAGFLTIRPEKE
jgi:hypothetical protein